MPSPVRLTTAETARRLGVKVETVYAYVSRGYLGAERSADGRSSLFDPREVERLARRGRPRRVSRGPLVDVAMQTAVTGIEEAGPRFRGHDVAGLLGRCTFEQVAELLWTGALPATPPSWPAPVACAALAHHGSVAGGAVGRLRVAAAMAGLDLAPTLPTDAPERFDPSALVAAGPGLIAHLVGALPVAGEERTPRLHLDGGTPPVRGSVAGHLAIRLSPRRPRPPVVRLVNDALVLLADHELAASTFAARIAASVRADAVGVVTAGLGALSGPLHGTAGRAVGVLLDDVAAHAAEPVVRRWASSRYGVPGVGHRLYPHGDPRASLLLDALFRSDPPARERRTVEEVLDAFRHLDVGHPNVDFALGAIVRAWGLVPDAAEAVFAVARTAGWLAHAAEEYERRPLRFRVRAAYVGP